MLEEPQNKEKFNEKKKGEGVSICFQRKDAGPDGYNLDFKSPTDVPEATNYSEWFKNNLI